MNKSDLLNYALDNDILDMSYIQEQVKMNERKKVLSMHTFSIWETKNGLWKTYLPANNKNHRRVVQRNTREEIEDVIIDYWKEKSYDPIIDDVFKQWLEKKILMKEIEVSTRDRYRRLYDQCFEEFGKLHINAIDDCDIEDFIVDAIIKHSLTNKAYRNLVTLINGIFKYAKKRKYTSLNISDVMQGIEISKKMFRQTIKKDEDDVFLDSERIAITNYLTDNPDILNLGLLLLFKSGLRVGELAALKKEDFQGNYLCVQRTEIDYRENGKCMYEVKDFPKTEAGIRKVIIKNSDLWILRKIYLLNPFGEYLIEKNGSRVKTYTYRKRLRRVCNILGIKNKSPHKIRKTYGSLLIDSGVNKSIVVRQMGHTDISTTLKYYYKNHSDENDTIKKINQIQNM